MTDVEKRFSFLNRWFVFVKRGQKETAGEDPPDGTAPKGALEAEGEKDAGVKAGLPAGAAKAGKKRGGGLERASGRRSAD